MSVKSFLKSVTSWPLPRHAPRLISVTTTRQRYTLKGVTRALKPEGIRHQRWTYEQLFSKRTLPGAAYVLTDFDRLHPWQREMATLIHDRLVESGAPVLNNPRHFLPRDALLRRLYREGMNQFDCWRPAEGEWPDRFPVFLRTIYGHRGVESDLLTSREAAETALQDAMAKGLGIADLVFIEYCSETEPGTTIFRKRASYIINKTVIRALTVSQSTWVAKMGEVGITPEDAYLRDLAEQTSDPYAAQMKAVFDLAGVTFGRVDFTIVNGTPQVYEINTNPVISWTETHPSQTRLETDRLIREGVVKAFRDLDYPDPKTSINLSDIWHRWNKGRRDLGQT